MSSSSESRRRWINLGELIAVAALIVSAAGVWVSWHGDSKPDAGTRKVSEQKQSIPLILRGHVEDGGRRIAITPVESGHALESLKIVLPGGTTIESGSEGELSADQFDAALKARDKELKGSHSVPVQVAARYVEMGQERTSSRTYRLAYRWDGGGLFGGHSVRLTSLSRG
ncbi:MAG: hypothetical protein ABIW33_09050 [Sphingomicrobium sp.]